MRQVETNETKPLFGQLIFIALISYLNVLSKSFNLPAKSNKAIFLHGISDMMNRLLLTIIFSLCVGAVFAQRDSILAKMPMVNGRLVYTDTVAVKGRNRDSLDSSAKKWFANYFKYQRADTLAKDQDASSSVLGQAAVIFRMATTSGALVKYDFFLVMTININCSKNGYTYKIFDIFFVPKNGLFRAVSAYQTSPEYLISLLNKKHLGLGPSVNFGRKKINEYLINTHESIEACIESLKKTMEEASK